MRRDRAATRPIATLLSIALTLAGVLCVDAPVSAETAARDDARPTPTYRVAPPDVGPRAAAERSASASSRRSARVSGTGHITGTVTGPAGQPLEEVWVDLYRWDDDEQWWDELGGWYTGADGAYDLNGLAAGSYRIAFDPGSVPGGYEGEYWDDAASFDEATQIDLADGQAATGTDAELAVRGRITGVVTGPAGQPLSDIKVTAYRREIEDGDGGDEDVYWDEYTDAWTGSDGSYDLGAMHSGTYRIEFYDYMTGYVGEYWRDTTLWADASGVQVTAGTVTSGINAQLALGGVVDGVVTAPDGHALPDIEVRAYRWDQAGGTWEWAYYTYTDDNGFYDMSGLPDGSYRLGFSNEDGYYATEYWDNATTLDDATTIAVTAGNPRHGRNAQLSEFGTIDGTVTDSSGQPLWDVEVYAFRWSDDEDVWEPYYNTYTDEDGSYEMGGLEPGSYRLRFWGDADTVKEYWDDADTLGSATTLDVALDRTLSHVDAELAPASAPSVAVVGLPTITGLPQIGSTLTATSGTWTPATGLAFSYRWFVGGEPVAGATSPTYVPTSVDLGKTVQVQVRATGSGYTSRTASSSATGAVAPAPAPVNTVQPGFTKTPRVGVLVTAKPGVWSKSATTFTYQWLVKGLPVAGATHAAYTPVAADAGKELTVRVTATGAGGAAGVATSAASVVAKGVLKATKKPKVTGTAKKNATVTVSPGSWSPKAKVAYQWYAGSKAVAKATGARLKITGKVLKAVKGKAISVLLTITAPGYTTVTTRLKVPGKV
ncbi:carboxypeptidase regulatory-like domain-containing protein [Nocardioides conyzicola]|uniref:alpha-amylase n=1 Tax=Nocardioides conyzicola TaxID=1651781 RepID=A0ABP8XVC0_9ACTN